jgi:hypothetical protein
MAASAAASALTNNIFCQTGSLKKYTCQCKKFGFIGDHNIKIIEKSYTVRLPTVLPIGRKVTALSQLVKERNSYLNCPSYFRKQDV